jgi:hypothetical protein
VQSAAGPPEHFAGAQAVAARAARLWREVGTGSAAPVLQLCGGRPDGRLAVAGAIAASLGRDLLPLSAAALLAPGRDPALLALLCQREYLLAGRIALLEWDGTEAGRLEPLIAAFGTPLMLGLDEQRALAHRATVALAMPVPSIAERRAMWFSVLGRQPGADPALDEGLGQIAAQFQLGETAMRTAAAEAAEAPDLCAALWSACRAQARPRLDDLAARIEPWAGWDDIALLERATTQLHEIAAQVSERYRVYADWGFAARTGGIGIAALFSGTSGSGKTMAAEVLARALSLDLYRIDLSSVVSKYIGETEKHLRRLFDAAEDGGAILLFDEADALFGRRSEVKDSHDRYSNIEVSYLLQRIESYAGLAILTTNMKSALDGAFVRRLRFIVDFPFPDAAQRVRLWQRAFPPATPTKGLVPERLAQLSVTGGSVRNIALSAAFLAAAEGGPVTMARIAAAARMEYAKLGRSLTAAELAGWGSWAAGNLSA